MAVGVSGASSGGGGAASGESGRCNPGEGAGGPRRSGPAGPAEAGFRRRPRGARPRLWTFRRRLAGRGQPWPAGPGAPQTRLYPGLHHRPLCVSAPAPEAPRPAALSYLIGSAEGLLDWPPSRSEALLLSLPLVAGPASQTTERGDWPATRSPWKQFRETPRAAGIASLSMTGGGGGARAISSRFQSASR